MLSILTRWREYNDDVNDKGKRGEMQTMKLLSDLSRPFPASSFPSTSMISKDSDLTHKKSVLSIVTIFWPNDFFFHFT